MPARVRTITIMNTNEELSIMKKLSLTLLTLFPVLAHAHDEHGTSLFSNIWHVFSSPEHMWPLTIGLLLVAVAVGVAIKRS